MVNGTALQHDGTNYGQHPPRPQGIRTDTRNYPLGPIQHENVMRNQLITTILTQYHIFKRIKVFGDPGVSAVPKELKQLHDKMVMDPKNANEMTTSKKKAALQYLMILKQKICGKIKGRGCSDRRKQCEYLTKGDTGVQTVEMENLFLKCLIDAMEQQKSLRLTCLDHSCRQTRKARQRI